MAAVNRLDELERMEKAATPGRWQWYNGCSWWRLGLADDQGKHAAVICPTVDRDRHPNLNVSQGDMDIIAALRNSAPALLAVARAAETLLALMDFADKTCGGKEELRAALDKLMKGESL